MKFEDVDLKDGIIVYNCFDDYIASPNLSIRDHLIEIEYLTCWIFGQWNFARYEILVIKKEHHSSIYKKALSPQQQNLFYTELQAAIDFAVKYQSLLVFS